MRSIEDFYNFYTTDIRVSLVELESIRKKILHFIITSIACILGLLGLILLVVLSNDIPIELKWLILSIGFIGVLYYLISRGIRISKHRFRERFKGEVIERIIHFISPELIYRPEELIPKEDFRKSRIFLQSLDIYRGDDYVEGKIDKTSLRFSEIDAQNRVQTKDSTTYHTIFKGLFFIADFNKSFQGSTVLIQNSFGSGKRFLKRMAGLARREKYVELEDPRFNERFNCYSDDDITARYILSPALMHRITEFRDKYPKNNISMSFVDEKLYIAVSHRKPLFEARITQTLLNPKLIQSYFDDIKLAVEIVEDLNLNTRIWSKD